MPQTPTISSIRCAIMNHHGVAPADAEWHVHPRTMALLKDEYRSITSARPGKIIRICGVRIVEMESYTPVRPEREDDF